MPSRRTTFFFLLLCCLLISPSSLYAADITQSFTYEGIDRSYILHIPSGYNPSTPMPVVLVLHGGGGSPEGIRWTSQMNTVADREGFIVAYPGGTAYYPLNIRGLGLVWNDGMVLPTLLKANDVGYIGAVLDKLEANYNINQQMVYATGYSNGAFMACDLVKELPNRIAAIGLVGAILSTNQVYPAPDRAVPLIDFQGKLDPFALYNGSTNWLGLGTTCEPVLTSISSWVAHNGDLPDPVETQVINQAVMNRWSGGGADVVLWTLNDGGHTWPGGNFTRLVNGPTNRDISASQEMWDFFEQYYLDPASGKVVQMDLTNGQMLSLTMVSGQVVQNPLPPSIILMGSGLLGLGLLGWRRKES